MMPRYRMTAILLISFLLLGVSISAQQLSPEIIKRYEELLKDVKTPYGTEEIPSYDTPPIYSRVVDTVLYEKEDTGISVPPPPPERMTFYDLVIIEDDTVQKLLKAAPKKLDFFGKGLFSRSEEFMPSDVPVSGDYKLGSGDNIIISVWGNVDYEYNLTIDREGKVFIPKAGTVALAGYTLGHAKEKIRTVLSRIYSNFEVDVTLGKIRGVTVFVVGEAERPGTYSLSGLAHVIDALVTAGGPNRYGSYRNIKVYRGGRQITTLDLYDFILNGETSGNIQLTSGDVVAIPRLGPTVKVRGRVRRPAIYELTKASSGAGSATVAQVIELAGGTLPDANICAVIVDRVEDGIHKVVTFNLEDSTTLKAPVFDGDDFSVFPIEGYRQDVVFLQGQVVQPGPYGISDSTKVSDILRNGEQLLPDAYLKRADLIRMLPNRRMEIISVNLVEILNNPKSPSNIILQSEDRLVVYSIWDIEDKDYVGIYGSVRQPGKYNLFNDMRLSDLIFEAGGTTRDAFLEEADLARVRPGEYSRITKVNLQRIIENPGAPEDIILAPYDILFVREIPGWKLQEVVKIVGEVKFPGEYALTNPNERFSDLIQRAGGFTDDAFLNGVVFIRPSLAKDIKRRNIHGIIQQTQETILDNQGDVIRMPFIFSYEPEQIARIIIDMERVLKGRMEDDIVLEAGDSIYVPKIPTGVNVVGMVASNGTIHWVSGKSVRYYIARAGGLTKNADKGEIRIVKPNGKVLKASMSTRNVEPGDAIIVPQQIKRDTDWMEIVSNTVSILSGLASTLYILLNI